MSMEMLTVLQFLETLGIYLFMTVLVPAMVFGRKIKDRSLTERFFFYFTVGNFYIMNLVFLLQLLHISNCYTLFLGTAVPAGYAWMKWNHVPLVSILLQKARECKRVMEGKLGIRTVCVRILAWIYKGICKMISRVCGLLKGRWLDWVLIGVLVIWLLYVYGSQLVTSFGYSVSDMPVHNYWINYMSRNDIFVAGVYPFGFHCMIYYLHEVFHIDTYVLLRVFALVQNLLIHGMLVVFLKGCCKGRFTPYIGVFAYSMSGLFREGTYSRYLNSLPQEFGMLFILPAIYFGFRFFQIKREELESEAIRQEVPKSPETGKLFHKLAEKCRRRLHERKVSDQYLVGFAMSFSMTLAVHFYDTMIAGLFCIGIAVGYLTRFLKKKYFTAVVTTCFISVMIAVFPMAVALATGTPMQASLRWGMSVMNGETQVETPEDIEEMPSYEYEGTWETSDAPDSQGNQESWGEQAKPGEAAQPGIMENLVQSAQKIKQRAARVLYQILLSIHERILAESGWPLKEAVLCMIGVLLLLGILFQVLHHSEYGAKLVSVAVFMICMLMLLASSYLGLPSLMDASRSGIYFAYMLAIVISMTVDGTLFLMLGRMKKRWLMSLLSLAVLAGMILTMWNHDRIRKPLFLEPLETNEAVTCLTSIIMEEEDFTWTICSANDELRMGEDHGFHYELTDFLWSMEWEGKYANMTIPTASVYFFIEKVPIDYSISYENSGQSISAEGAARPLPWMGHISNYQGENRWIIMSRMYYWAQEFQKLYPNEMQVYLETDRFVCYKVEQNINHLFNFSIDYGYNVLEKNRE